MMEFIGRNNDLLEALTNGLSILSSKIYKVTIYEKNEVLNIEVCFNLLYSNNSKILMLKFIGVEEYSFYYNSQYIFYNVESYKFFEEGEKVYISFDPYDEEAYISENDQDFILSDSVEGYLVPIE